nr:FMRFamide receptor [Biomphalaria glabrata]
MAPDEGLSNDSISTGHIDKVDDHSFVFFNNFQNYSFNNSSYWLRVLNKFPSDDVFRFYHMTCVGDTADMMREVINMFTTKPNTTEPGNPIFGALLYLYVSPVLLILGTLGNLFSFIILRRKQMLKVSSYLYLATLAIVDTVVLYCGLLRHWIRELAQVDIQDTSDGACKFIVTISYVSSDLSAWLITAVTVERYIVVCFPFRASSMCNVSRAKKVIALLIFIILSINVHFLWTVEIDNKGRCETGIQHRAVIDPVWPWVDIFIYSTLPFLIITVLNILIIKEVAGARSNRVLLSGAEADSSTLTSGHTSRVRRSKMSESQRLTVLLLTVSFMFILLTLPNNILLICTRVWNQYQKDIESSKYLARTFTELLMYINHSINFFLYCATGNKFRQQILDLFRCQHRRQRRGVHTMVSNTHSIRRTSQSYVANGGGHDAVGALRRRSSCLSSDANGDSTQEGDSGGSCSRAVTVKACVTKGTVKCSIANGDKNGNDHSKSRPTNGILRSRPTKDTHKREKSNKGSLRRCYRLNRHSGADYDEHIHDDEFIEAGTKKPGSLRNKSPQGDSCKMLFSSKKLKTSAASKLNSSMSGNSSPKDKEYIVLHPTIRWCEASVQS